MENEILENGTTPETEAVAETVEAVETAKVVETAETVETVETVATEQSAAKAKFDVKDNVITATMKKVADKGKELVSDPKGLWEKIKALPKKIWIFAGAGLAVLIAAIVLLSMLGNTYKTPVNLMEDAANTNKASKVLDSYIAMLNGFCEDECDDIFDLLKKTEAYEDLLEDFEDRIEESKERYGSNYKIKYKIVDKEELEREQRKIAQSAIRSRGEHMLEDLEDMDSDDYADLADELDITKTQARKLVKYEKEIAKTLKKAKIEEGYKLTVEVTTTGRELDEPITREMTVYVYKIDGRWVSTEALQLMYYLLP